MVNIATIGILQISSLWLGFYEYSIAPVFVATTVGDTAKSFEIILEEESTPNELSANNFILMGWKSTIGRSSGNESTARKHI